MRYVVIREAADMATGTKRATIYLDSDLHRALKMKAALSSKSVSDLVNDAVRDALAQDEEDLRAFDERFGEPLVAYEEMLGWLKSDGKL
jgi:predicted transcriptional regulator